MASMEDSALESVLDAVDAHSEHHELVQAHLAEGFMALARERYRDPTSLERLSRAVYDARASLRADMTVSVDDAKLHLVQRDARTPSTSPAPSTQSLRRRGAAQSSGSFAPAPARAAPVARAAARFIALPSAPVRDAAAAFRLALEHAVAAVNARAAVDALLPPGERSE